jgi:hypothetical protein
MSQKLNSVLVDDDSFSINLLDHVTHVVGALVPQLVPKPFHEPCAVDAHLPRHWFDPLGEALELGVELEKALPLQLAVDARLIFIAVVERRLAQQLAVLNVSKLLYAAPLEEIDRLADLEACEMCHIHFLLRMSLQKIVRYLKMITDGFFTHALRLEHLFRLNSLIAQIPL